MEKLVAGNVSETIFKMNEKQIKVSDDIMPAYIQQVRMSTYFQDSPCEILLSSKKYGLTPLGGAVTSGPNGYRPGTSCLK